MTIWVLDGAGWVGVAFNAHAYAEGVESLMAEQAWRNATRDAPRRRDLPPGQHEIARMPPTTGHWPNVATQEWSFTLSTHAGVLRRWDWPAFRALPAETVSVDLHSARGWSVFGTSWIGVPMRTLFADIAPEAEFAQIRTYNDYETNLPLEDLLELPTWIAFGFDGAALPTPCGGPARLLVPHLYLWKSAKWVREITLSDHDEPGTRERAGYHNYGDPWREQRHRDD